MVSWREDVVVRRRRRPLVERFWSKVDKRGPDECWVWKAATTPNGYGHIASEGSQRHLSAHRVAYELAIGPIPTGLCVLHRCDNKPCVNPAHLFVGTHRDNYEDMRAKGRLPAPVRLRGGTNGQAKLTEVAVRDIRRRADLGVSQRFLAKEYGVSRYAVYAVIHRFSWAHVT